MIVLPITVGAFQENCYVVTTQDSSDAVIVDPGSEGERIIDEVERLEKTPQAIWITHAHVDHIGAVADVKRRWDVPIYLHPLDEPLYRVAGRQAQLYGLPYEDPPPPDRPFSEGDTLQLGDLTLRVMHCPGHAPGHVVILGHGNLLAGDCLFAGSIGRTDLPFSNPAHLEASLRRISALPPETAVHPGHGDSTTVGEELLSNPFLNGTARISRAT